MVLSVELASYVLVLCWLHVSPELIAVTALGIYVGTRAFVVLLSFVIAFFFQAARSSIKQINSLAAIKLFLSELAAWLVLYSVLFPFEKRFENNDPRDLQCNNTYPVLLVHGFLCNGAFWWFLKRYLRRFGITNLFSLNLEPLIGDIDGYAEQIADKVAYIRRQTGMQKVIFVAHSMGGLAGRAYLGRSGSVYSIEKLITLGTPHHGTRLAWFLFGKNVRQMRPGSNWLTALNAKAQQSDIPITSIYSWHDNVVAPQDSSTLANAQNISIVGIGHLAMTFSRSVHRRVYEEIVETSLDAN